MWFFNKRYYRILSKLDNIEDSIVHNNKNNERILNMLSTEVQTLSDTVAASIVAQNNAVVAFGVAAQEIADLMAKLDLNSDDTARMEQLNADLLTAKDALVAATPAPVAPVEPPVG